MLLISLGELHSPDLTHFHPNVLTPQTSTLCIHMYQYAPN